MEHLLEPVKPYSMFAAGALFGGGWWAWVDAVVYSHAVLGVSVSPVYYIPGVVATLAVLLMATARNHFDGYEFDGYDGDECRAKCGLFIAYLAAFGSIAGAVAILVLDQQAHQDLNVGVGVVVQTAVLCLSGLLVWCVKNEDGDNGYSLLS